ncbi:hypothetical protein D3C79_1085320 [compost metagenome]
MSEMVEPVTLMRPGVVSIGVSGLNLPVSSAMPTVIGFIVEPGSKTSVIARLRSCSPVRCWRLSGT